MRGTWAVLLGGILATTQSSAGGLTPASAALVLVLILGNGLFVGVEFSLLTANRGEIDRRAAEGAFGARIARRAMGDLSVELTTCQLGITVLSLLLGYVAEPAIGQSLEVALGHWLGERTASTVGVIIALTVVTVLHMVLGEMVPKNIALASPERTVVVLAPVSRGLTVVARPLIRVLNLAAAAIGRLFGVQPTHELSEARSAAELAVLVHESGEGGVLEATDQELLSGAIGFAAIRIAELMVPRDRIVAVTESTTVAEAEEVVVSSGHSRLLVTAGAGHQQQVDAVVGFLHAKDLLTLDEAERGLPLPDRLLRRPLIVRDTMLVDEVLESMNQARRHVAVVVGADGRTAGLVTLEDLLEAIVGDITDETDRP